MSKYRFLWGNNQQLWCIQANLKSMAQYHNSIWNPLNNVIQISRQGKITTFHSIEDLDNDVERGKMFLDIAATNKFLEELKQRCAEYKKFFQELLKLDLTQMSNTELWALLQQIFDQWCRTIGYFRASQAEGTQYLLEKLKQNLSDKELALLTTPVELDEMNKERLDWHKLISKENSPSPLELKFIQHAQQYPWLVERKWTMGGVVALLISKYNYDTKNSSRKDIFKEKEELKQKQEEILLQKPEMKQLVETTQSLAVNRMLVKSCWAGSDFYLIPFFTEISHRTGVAVEEISNYYLIDELGELLLKNKKLSVEELESRKKCFVGLFKDSAITFYSGAEAEKIAQQELDELYDVKNKNELKGVVANHGKITGTVRVLYANDPIRAKYLRENFQKGEILITQMTQPNVMDIASRAGAIVTDEGGMLSHAAIISREFKIPCIVGTHFATSVFKDSDVVEVDAEKGVVRKIEINPQDFKPLFHGEFTTSYFVNEFWTGTSMARNRIIVIQKEKSWNTFIDNKGMEMCLVEGLNLFRNLNLFEKYLNEFKNIIKYSNEVLIPKYSVVPVNMTAEELRELFEFMKHYWYLYGFTEYPHIDLAYRKMLEDNNSIIRDNLNKTYAAKVEGRKVMNAFFFRGGVIPNVIEFFSKKYFRDSESAMYLSLAELLSLPDGKYPEQSKIKQRKNCTVLLSLQKECVELPVQMGIELTNKLMAVPQTDSVKGIIVNKGKATGKVVIASMLDNMEEVTKIYSKMEKKAILIAQTTSPELMLLCKNAVAIVTDQGGMMSHAAVISREMNIPCIVGTNYATEIFKDGDLVEVDAEKGVVRKINSLSQSENFINK